MARISITQRLGKRLTALREEQALTLAELGRRADVAASHIGGIERGERAPTVVVLEKLARALRVPTASFFEKENPPKPTRGEKVYYEVMGLLRDRDADYLRAVRGLIRAFDQALARASQP